MEFAVLFAHAVTSLPDATRRRMDGDAPLGWKTLEEPGTSAEFDEAVRAGRRLPKPVEALAAELIDEVGIVPLDLAAGADRERAANAWLRRIAIEPDGERYRLRNRRSCEVHAGIRPEAVAGYVVLALELATAVHEAAESWIEAGDRYSAMTHEGLAALARCAIQMSVRLKPAAEPDSGRGWTGKLAGILEDAWNAQSLAIREELCGAIRPDAASGACAPRRCYFAPADSYRVHAFDPGEIRWLRALGEFARDAARSDEEPDAVARLAPHAEPATTSGHANGSASVTERQRAEQTGSPAAASTMEPDTDSEELALGRELAKLQRAADAIPGGAGPVPEARTGLVARSGDVVDSLELAALEARVQAEATNSLELGSGPDGLPVDEGLIELRRAVARLPGAVRRRLGDSHGIGVAQALTRLRDHEEAEMVFTEARAAIAARQAPAWLEELALSLLADAGAQTRDGVRTGNLSLEISDGPDGYVAIETETGTEGQLTLPGLLEQVHLGLTFALHAWTGVETLRTAGTEGGWTLSEASNGKSGLTPSEREILEAAQQIERALSRTRLASLHRGRSPCALEQAAMAAEAIRAVGPSVRAAAGWPGAVEAPDSRDPENVAQVAAFAETLHEAVKTISNRVIAGSMATDHTERQSA